VRASSAAARTLLLLLLALYAAAPHPAWAQGGGGSSESDDTDDDDEDVLAPVKPAKRVSHFAIKPKERLGARAAIAQDLTLEAFVRAEEMALDNPLAWRSSIALGGVETAYKFGATTWFVTFESGEAYSQLYNHASATEYKLLSTVQRQIKLGGGATIVPRLQIGHEWSSDPGQERWKVQAKAPVFYPITESVLLIPMVPKLTWFPYTDRPDHRTDLTMNISAGVRWMITPKSFLQAEFGFENRWSNVRSAEFSRWLLAPEVNLRVAF
jgi:hypothetical protein